MNKEMSSTSERIGAITSEHRNFIPGKKRMIFVEFFENFTLFHHIKIVLDEIFQSKKVQKHNFNI